MTVTRIPVYFVIGTMKSGIDVMTQERLLISKQSTERKCRRVCRADTLRKYGGITMFKNKVKKVVAVALAAVLWVSGSSSALAASISGSGYTEGGDGGQTLISYTFNCKAYYTSTVDACIIDMRASSGNLVQFSYGQMTTYLKAGGHNITSMYGEVANEINSKNWTKVTGNAGKNQKTEVTYLKGGKENVYGFKIFEDIEAFY